MIMGEDMQFRKLDMSPTRLMGADYGKNRRKGHLPPPPYVVQVEIQRKNPMRVDAQNNLMIQAYTMAAQAGQNFPLSELFELMQVDGKDRILPKLREMDAQMQMMQQLQA